MRDRRPLTVAIMERYIENRVAAMQGAGKV
jgi:hypothetical protein